MASESGTRKIRVERKIIGAPAPKPVTVRVRTPRDYPGVARAQVDLALALTSPLLGGPPLCDELVALVCHLFSEEEAELARHLSGLVAKGAPELARAARRPLEEVLPILKRLADERFVILGAGRPEKRRYKLMPVMGLPGMFEWSLMGQDLETMSPWHRRAAELFEALFETGYVKGSGQTAVPLLRSLPISSALGAHPLALPSDKLEVVLDRYDVFAVGNCQCRMTRRVVGKGCDKPINNCLSMGKMAKTLIRSGQQREITRKDALEIKLEAERHGLVSWIMNMESADSQASCSCCGCCCGAMRAINEFNAPSIFAPPHFLPAFDRSRCSYCGKCARACPMGSLVVDSLQREAWQVVERCVGCGLCSIACDKERAISMEPVPDYRLPPDSWFATIAQVGPGLARNLTSAYLDRNPLVSWWKG